MTPCPKCRTYNQASYSICMTCGTELPRSGDGGTYLRGAGTLAKEAGQGVLLRIAIRVGVSLFVALVMIIYYSLR